MSLPNNYELFNFTDPIEEAFESVIESAVAGLSVNLPRSSSPSRDLEVAIRFADGTATGHVKQVNIGSEPVERHAVYDLFTGGIVEIDILRHRWDAESIEISDTTSRDLLSQLAGRIRFALRHVNASRINSVLVSPKITYIRPLAGSRSLDEDLGLDMFTLRYEINYGIPDDIWPRVLITEDGFFILAEDGSQLVAD